MIGYIESSSFPVYTYGEMIIKDYNYYIYWTPTNISSGTFYMEGSTYNFSDYNGSFGFNGRSITGHAFEYNRDLITVSTNARVVGSYAFQYCSSLQEVIMTDCSVIERQAFLICRSLSSVSLPNCKEIGQFAFQGCISLRELNLPECTHIYSQAFFSCNNFSTITLDNTTVCRLYSSDAFYGTGITSSTGFIFVPDSLYESYRTDSVWSYFFNRIHPSTWGSYYVEWSPYPVSTGLIYLGSDRIEYSMSEYVSSITCFDGMVNRVYPHISSVFVECETNASKFGSWCFNQCNSLYSLTLTNPSVVEAPDSTVLQYTMINSTSWGYIYVPDSLVSAYKTTEPWSYFSNRIFGINQESEYYINYTPYDITVKMDDKHTYSLSSYSGTFRTHAQLSFSAFENTSLQSIDCNMTSIPMCCFRHCSSLQYVSFSKCIRVDGRDDTTSGAFVGCSNLISVYLPECSYIGGDAFYGCSTLLSVYIPECKSIGVGAFGGCSSLISVDLPKCEFLSTVAFARCRSLNYISIPVCSKIADRVFIGCYSLSSIVLSPSCVYIGSSAFNSTGLQIITLEASSIVSLAKSNVFYSSPISGIFVPSDLVNGYKISLYWSEYSDIIYPINN